MVIAFQILEWRNYIYLSDWHSQIVLNGVQSLDQNAHSGHEV